jgi:glycosyltransferase involved in cell wall biosynthesis
MLEAMYLKIPVVATRCISFISESIIEGVTGYCVEVKDYKAMAMAMEKAVALKGNILNAYKTSKKEQFIDVFK